MLQISPYQSESNIWIGNMVSSVYVKNMVTGELTDFSGQLPITSIIMNSDNITCSCANFLLEVEFF